MLSTPTAETLPLGTVSETVDIYALRPVTLTDEIIGNVLPIDDDENTVWYRSDATENSSIPSWSLDAPEMTGSFPVFDGTTFVQSNYDRSNLNQTADHQNKKMVLASYGTNTTVGGADIAYIQLPSDQTFFGDSILEWSPTHYQEFLGTNVTDDLNSLVISTSLERDETQPLFLEGANHMTGGTVSDVDLQGNTTTSKRDYYHFHREKKSFTATLNSVPYAGLSAQLSQPKKASIASQLQAPGAWLNARLDATALSGAIGGAASALYWHWGGLSNAENSVWNTLEGTHQDRQSVIPNPMGQQAKNGPGFTRFPGLEPGATSPVFSHDAWDMGTLRLRADDSDGSLGTAYIMSENEVSNWRWYHYYRTYAFVPTQGDNEISFIKGGYGNPEFLGQAEDKRDRYWVGIRRAGNTWTSLNPNQTGNLDSTGPQASPPVLKKGAVQLLEQPLRLIDDNRRSPLAQWKICGRFKKVIWNWSPSITRRRVQPHHLPRRKTHSIPRQLR